ncbi:chemotaxis protein [Alishewanella longhuensis]|uniref:Chemotaxis protein n=1 Tax=Alishewanella longhuensis TaxID=1091037 RepID=A0ABQ3KVF8_9ALTE|nr:methyl-accepting chemotaxis protein [Alishewanella longhuensis]GHG62868.1 chemotaxis protein [Alishewanella longhuensis]
MGFSNKIKVISLIIVLLPLIIATTVITLLARSELFTEAEARLIAVREIKERNIAAMLNEFSAGLEVAISSVSQLTTLQQIDQLEQSLPGINQQLGFYDIFVIDSKGDIIYTVAKEADLHTNLNSGPYRDSGLGKLYQAVKSQPERLLMADFSPYAPSNNEAAAFLGKRINLGGDAIVVAAQLSIDKINSVMQIRAGMGQSGETYLVGTDNRMRSDSFLDPVNRNIQASFRGSVAINGVDTAAVQQALAGQSGVLRVNDYNNNPVLSAYAPIDMFGVRWALLAEIDIAEITAPAQRMLVSGLILSAIAVLLAVLAAQLVCRIVITPLGGEPNDMCQLTSVIASGDFTTQLQVPDKPNHVMGWLAKMQHTLKGLIAQLMGISKELEMTATQNSAAITQADGSIQLQARETDMLATAVEEMSYAAAEIGKNSALAADEVKASQQAGEHLVKTLEATQISLQHTMHSFTQIHQEVAHLDQDSKKISVVLSVINAIAEQTNLLALNAAIEAARAGEHGRGFAVVADEVRQLAFRVQEAIKDISSVLNGITTQSDSLAKHSVICANESEKTLTQAQSMATAVTDIRSRLATLKDLMIQTATAAEEQTTVSATLAHSISRLSAAAEENSTAISQVAVSTQQLLGMAQTLGHSAGQFRV